MREYSKVSPTFWTGPTGKAIRKRGPEAVVVACYLMTAPLSNMLGLYTLPMHYIATDTGLGAKGASKGLQACEDCFFCEYDSESETVWVREMAAWQIAKQLKETDNRCLGIQREYLALPKNPFLGEFFDHYRTVFHLTERRGSEAPSKPLPSHEHEHEQEHEQNTAPPSATSGEVAPPLFPEVEKPAKGKAAKHAEKMKRLREVTSEAIDTFNSSKLTKPEGAVARVSVAVGLENRVKQVGRIVKIASEIAAETSESKSTQITREFWEDYWSAVAEDDFMAGRKKPGEGHSNWKPDFEFLTREKTMLKIFDRAGEEP